MSSRVNEINGENLHAPQSKILATPMSLTHYQITIVINTTLYEWVANERIAYTCADYFCLPRFGGEEFPIISEMHYD